MFPNIVEDGAPKGAGVGEPNGAVLALSKGDLPPEMVEAPNGLFPPDVVGANGDDSDDESKD